MAKLTLGQAAKETGLNKSTIYRAIKKGKLSADFDGEVYKIDPAELFRVFEPAIEKRETEKLNTSGTVPKHGETMAAITETVAELRARIETLTTWNNDLRAELSEERAERRKLTLMLTNQSHAPQGENNAPQGKEIKRANNWPLVVLVFLLVAVSVGAIVAVKMGVI